MFEGLKKLIEESVSKALEEGADAPGGLKDANGRSIVTNKLVRPADKSDKRWGQIKGVTIDLKVRVEWLDQESKYSGKTHTAESPGNLEIY